jgi:hypothetical protein
VVGACEFVGCVVHSACSESVCGVCERAHVWVWVAQTPTPATKADASSHLAQAKTHRQQSTTASGRRARRARGSTHRKQADSVGKFSASQKPKDHNHDLVWQPSEARISSCQRRRSSTGSTRRRGRPCPGPRNAPAPAGSPLGGRRGCRWFRRQIASDRIGHGARCPVARRNHRVPPPRHG